MLLDAGWKLRDDGFEISWSRSRARTLFPNKEARGVTCNRFLEEEEEEERDEQRDGSVTIVNLRNRARQRRRTIKIKFIRSNECMARTRMICRFSKETKALEETARDCDRQRSPRS